MSTDTDYKVQVSIKHGPNQSCMTNVRGGTVDEVEELLLGLVRLGPEIAAGCEALGAVQTVATVMPGTTYAGLNAPAQTSSPAQQMCPHGAMKFIEKPEYAGHFCPADKTNPTRCKPVYVRKGAQ